MAETGKQNKTEKQGNPLKIVIIVLLALILVGGGIFAGYYFSSKMSPKNKNNMSEKEMEEQILKNKRAFALGDEFIVNLKAESGQRFIKARISLGYNSEKQNEKFEAELKEKAPILRDSINTVLRSKKITDITEPGIEKIKDEIKNKINPFFKNGQISDVYFPEILVQ